MARKKIGAMLEEKGFINEFQLVAALSHQRKWKSKLGQSLIELGYLEEDKLFEVLAEQLEVPFINLKGVSVPIEILRRITKDFAREWQAVPVSFADGVWTVAVAEPEKDKLVPTLSLTLNGKIKIALATPTAIEILTRKVPDKVSLGVVQPVKKAFVRDGNGAFVPAPDNGMPIIGDPTPPARPAVRPPEPRLPRPEDDFLRMPDAPPDLSVASTSEDLFSAPDLPPAEPDPEAPIDVGDIMQTEPDLPPPVEEEVMAPPVGDLPPLPAEELPPMPADEPLAMPDEELALPVDEPLAMPDDELALPVDELPPMPVAEPAAVAAPPLEMEAPELDLPPLEAPTLDLPPLPDLAEPAPPPVAQAEEPLAMPADDDLALPVAEPPAVDMFTPPEMPEDEPVAMGGEEDLPVVPVGPAETSMDLPEGDDRMELEPAYAGTTIDTGEAPPLDSADDRVPLEAPNETAAGLSSGGDSDLMSLDDILSPGGSNEPMELETSSAPPLGGDDEPAPPMKSAEDFGLPPLPDAPPLDLELPGPAEPPASADGDMWGQPQMDSAPPGEELQPPTFDEEKSAPDLAAPEVLVPPPDDLLSPPTFTEPAPVPEPLAPPDLGDEVMEVPEVLTVPELSVPPLDLSVPDFDSAPTVAPAPVAPVAPVVPVEPVAPPAPAEAAPEEPDEDTMALTNQIKALEMQIQGMTGVMDSLKGMLKERKGKKK